MKPKIRNPPASKLEDLVIYRDDHHNPLIPVVKGIAPTTVDLHIPPLNPRDLEKLLRLSEPRRTNKWIQMVFTDDDAYLVDPEILWRAYRAAFEPLMRRDLDKTDASHQQLVVSAKFCLILMRAIHGVTSWGGGTLGMKIKGAATSGGGGLQGKIVVRGVRARTQALTFPSTNRESQMRQLEFYRKNNEIAEPQSLFAQKLAQDPLFMQPKAKGGKPLGHCEGSEAIGFPGVSTVKRPCAHARMDELWGVSEQIFEGAREREFGDAIRSEREYKEKKEAEARKVDGVTRLFESMNLSSRTRVVKVGDIEEISIRGAAKRGT